MLNETINGYNVDLNFERGLFTSALGIMESTQHDVVRNLLAFVNKRGCVENADYTGNVQRKRQDQLIGK